MKSVVHGSVHNVTEFTECYRHDGARPCTSAFAQVPKRSLHTHTHTHTQKSLHRHNRQTCDRVTEKSETREKLQISSKLVAVETQVGTAATASMLLLPPGYTSACGRRGHGALMGRVAPAKFRFFDMLGWCSGACQASLIYPYAHGWTSHFSLLTIFGPRQALHV